MKKLIALVTLVFSTLLVNAQDLTFDSVAVISPYWGLKFESGTSGDPYMNCGQTNTNFQTGQPYLLARFPIRLANMGTNVAYLGTYGVNGLTHDSCYSPQFTSPTDYINIPNFVLASITDSCGNVIASSRKTDWSIQNNSVYAMSKYNGQWTYITNYFGTQPTTGTAINPTKDWLESLCGTLDTNLALSGRLKMDTYYNNCVVCDSLVLFPNYSSDDYSVIQLPTNLAPGHYKLVLAGNFSQYEATNCYPNTITFPFYWDGSVGNSSTYPYFANGVTYGATTACIQVAPQTPTNVLATNNTSTVGITWTASGQYTGFEVTPIYTQGNTERLITGRKQSTSTTNISFDSAILRSDAIALGAGNGPAKYKFLVKAINGSLTSGDAKTRQAVNVK
jgi:hypothetical protein